MHLDGAEFYSNLHTIVLKDIDSVAVSNWIRSLDVASEAQLVSEAVPPIFVTIHQDWQANASSDARAHTCFTHDLNGFDRE